MLNFANKIPTSTTAKSLNGRTFYELWTEKKPNVSHFKDFYFKVFCLPRDLCSRSCDSWSHDEKLKAVKFSEETEGSIGNQKTEMSQVIWKIEKIKRCVFV